MNEPRPDGQTPDNYEPPKVEDIDPTDDREFAVSPAIDGSLQPND